MVGMISMNKNTNIFEISVGICPVVNLLGKCYMIVYYDSTVILKTDLEYE